MKPAYFHRLALISTLVLVGLSGCGGTSGNGDQVGNGTTVEYSPTAKIIFDPANGKIPTTNDLLFGSDGTLNFPMTGDAATDGLRTMLNTLDGFSLTMPFTLTLTEAPKTTSVVLGQTVQVFEVSKTNNFVSTIVREVPNTELLATLDSTGLNLAFVPLKPLKESTSYLIVLTNGLKDKNDKAFSTSTSYAVLKGSDPLTSATSEALRQQINAYENTATSAGITKENIILSWSFTTQSTSPVLKAVKAQATAQPLVTQSTGANTPLSAATIHKGTLQVPYYLSKTAPLTAFWKGAGDSLLTRYNPTPKSTSTETIPVLMIVPKGTMPAAGWPVVIYQHGITRDRTTLLALADSLARAGYAAIAIDLPLHGMDEDNSLAPLLRTTFERTFNLDAVSNTDPTISSPDGVVDRSGASFINLAAPLVSRDNIRQGISDLLVLRSSLGALQSQEGVKLDASQVGFVAMSLGGVIGTGYLNIEDRVTPSILNVTGGGIARLLDGSVSYGPIIRAGLAKKGINADTDAYNSFMYATQFMVDTADPINLATGIAQKHPVLFQEVVGSSTSPSDQVIPNAVKGYSLSGSEPLIKALGLTSVSTTTSDVDGVVRFTAGEHSSLLRTTVSPATTVEMQKQIANFMYTKGKTIVVTDTSVVK